MSRLPLRVRLVATFLVLAFFGLLLSGFAATASLHSYLLRRIDDQLVSIGQGPGSGGGVPGGGGTDRFTTIYFGEVTAPGVLTTRRVPPGMKGPKLPTTLTSRPSTVSSIASGEDQWRVIAYQVNDGAIGVFGINLKDLHNTTRQLEHLELLIGLGVLVVLGCVGYVVVRRSLKPLVAVESAAEAIALGDFTQRVPESDPRTEVGSLSQSFNTMVAQIETSFAAQAESEADARASEERMRRFIGDASHELRTPLTSMRGFAELYRQGALPEKSDVDRAMSRVEGEAARMGLLVEDLLLLARLDQQRPLEHQPVDLLELAGDAVADAKAIDPGRAVSLEAVASGPAPLVDGDAQRLRQVFGNLVSNALNHTEPGTPVVVRVSTSEADATVEVIDSGSGISAADRPHVFERFFRTDESRTRASGGTGLGLSIVAALVAAHQGSVSVDETPGGGATFKVRLPLA